MIKYDGKTITPLNTDALSSITRHSLVGYILYGGNPYGMENAVFLFTVEGLEFKAYEGHLPDINNEMLFDIVGEARRFRLSASKEAHPVGWIFTPGAIGEYIFLPEYIVDDTKKKWKELSKEGKSRREVLAQGIYQGCLAHEYRFLVKAKSNEYIGDLASYIKYDNDNTRMLKDTLKILKHGCYRLGDKKKTLKLTHMQMETAEVFLPDDVKRICEKDDINHAKSKDTCQYSCQNIDSYALAIKRKRQLPSHHNLHKRPVLVLNLANPVNRGGGVFRGSKAQEEDLCRRSSLLMSLTSVSSTPYYEYNRSLNTYMGSDAIIIHPHVEIIKDEKGQIMEDTELVAVMTCAAPLLRHGLEGLTQVEYEAMVYNRITGMLKLAAWLGYENLVLGAFGCGAFKNDAHIVSDLFYRALKEFNFDGMRENDMFRSIDFAILDHSQSLYNFKEFSRNFSDFYREEEKGEFKPHKKEKKDSEARLDAIRGCIFGGAVGDALGYSVEFLKEDGIFSKYGLHGITVYDKDPDSGKAMISDDTQMTLFTANGLLVGDTRCDLKGINVKPRIYVRKAYHDWLLTQELTWDEAEKHKRNKKGIGQSWLLDVPELYDRRAPGHTCLTALNNDTEGIDDYVKAKRNDSKGCGGIMRVAPLAVNYQMDIEKVDMEAAQLAAITHGHSLGYMPAAVLVHIINRIIFPPRGYCNSLKEIIIEARDTVAMLFDGDPYIPDLVDIIDKAVRLSEDTLLSDLDCIHKLGEGWVAEETLAIALCCALRYQNDFSAGVIAAVNHNGDSDSTGAVAGNILGALLGYQAIEEKWKKDLELSDVILEIADDLCNGCKVLEADSKEALDWKSKYVDMNRPTKQDPPVFFWEDTKKNGYLSNWYQRTFVIDDFEYLHVEQYMMVQKAKTFHDSKRYTAILRATKPKECKDLGKQVKPFDAKVWSSVSYDVVKTGNRAKFEQNPDLKEALLKTGNAVLAEASPFDVIWGIGLDASKAAETDPSNWPGQNLLGKILMELREEFRKEE